MLEVMTTRGVNTEGDWSPSEAWRQEIFSSPPRIDIQKNGKSTTRHPVSVGWTGQDTYVSGGHERVAALLMEALWAVGYVRRWKPQPLNLMEIDGPDITPDFLCELHDRTLHVIEVKAKRFVSPEIDEKFMLEKALLNPKAINFLLWTNADALSSATSHTVSELERCRRYSSPPEIVNEIRLKAGSLQTLGQLLEQYSWDDVLSAAAQQAFHFDFTKQIHEKTPLLRNYSHSRYDYLFARRDAAASWWDSLGSPKA